MSRDPQFRKLSLDAAPADNEMVGFNSADSTWKNQTAAELGLAASGAAPTIAVKAADESVSSSTTLQVDDDLKFTVAADETWVFQLVIFGSSANGAGDLKYGFSIPSGTTGRFTNSGRPTNEDMVNTRDLDGDTNVGNLASGADHQVIYISGVAFVSSTAGTINWQWAQSVSDSTATVVKKGSHLVAWKA